MTMGRAVWLECDGQDCDEQYPGHLLYDTAGSLRPDAKRQGWKHRDGRDLCPNCSATSQTATSEGDDA